jgi:hypothetical protein
MAYKESGRGAKIEKKNENEKRKCWPVKEPTLSPAT